MLIPNNIGDYVRAYLGGLDLEFYIVSKYRTPGPEQVGQNALYNRH
jgi:hypothetical protein